MVEETAVVDWATVAMAVGSEEAGLVEANSAVEKVN